MRYCRWDRSLDQLLMLALPTSLDSDAAMLVFHTATFSTVLLFSIAILIKYASLSFRLGVMYQT